MPCVESSYKFCRAGDNTEKRFNNARKIKINLVQPLIRTITERFKDYGDEKVFDEMQRVLDE